LTAKRYRLKTATLAIENISGRSGAVFVPVGAIVEISSEPNPSDTRRIEVLWEQRALMIFADDLTANGEELI
jgi:hypothetical protein